MKKILLTLLVGLFLISLASAWSNTTFNNSLGSEIISLTAGGNYTRYIQIPSSVNVLTNAFFNITIPYGVTTKNPSEVDYSKTSPTGDTMDKSTQFGMKVVMNKDKYLMNMTKFGGDGSTSCYILNSSKSVLTNGNFIGDLCTLSSPYKLSSGTIYYFTGAGTSVPHKYDGGLSLPHVDTELNWTDCLFDGSDTSVGTYATIISVGLADLEEETNLTVNVEGLNVFTQTIINASISNLTVNTGNIASSVSRYLNSTYLSGSNYLIPFIFSSASNTFMNYSNILFTNEGFKENSQTYSPIVSSGDNTQFVLNITSNDLITSATLIYNNTRYLADLISSQNYDYIISRNITTPTVSSQLNKTFYWEILLNGVYYNSTSYNQTINEFGIDNCAANTVLLLNYTIYNEITKLLVSDINNISLKLNIDIYANDYSTLVGGVSFNSSTNHTRVCLKSNLSESSQYYMDAEAQFTGGTGHVKKFYYIQKHLLTNNTIPVNVLLYSLNSSLSTNFIMTFKNSNFIKEPNVIIDVTKKYIEEGLFRTVEIPKTDSNGQATLHLQTGESIYSMTFKKNGEILAILSNVIAQCQSEILEECTIKVNAYSSNLELPNFNYIEGIHITEELNRDTKTITSTFVSESGTKEVTLNVTKFDRFGNTHICSTSVISSSGSLSCIIPDSYGNATISSEVYSNGIIASTRTYSLRGYTPDTGGSNVILSLLIIITLSMMFISDLRGILLGCFIGIVLSSTLLYINSGNLFSIGTASTWALVVVIMLMWKINHKEES